MREEIETLNRCLNSSAMNATNHVKSEHDDEEKVEQVERDYLMLDDYDCIGFDLDHTLCRYNIGPMIRFEYDLLAKFLTEKRGYDEAIKVQSFDSEVDFVCKGLTLDIAGGNLLRLGKDGVILAASHGTRKMNDVEIERQYGRYRNKHITSDYALHLKKHGPLGMGEFGLAVHSFMDYFDYPTILLCGRIVDVLDQINNHGRPMEEYFFWPDVLDGLKEMFTRTQFVCDQGGYFPEIKAHPERFIMKRRPEFRDWLKMLRQNGKFLYVITGSHVDFASHVASYALGEDWKDLFDIVIFFARKPSFFIDRRPFWKLEAEKEVESFTGWDELDTNNIYSQGNWHDLNEFFEYATEWEPSASLYFGDNILQDILAPNKFTKNCDCVAISEEMMAEGMLRHPPKHPHAKDLVSSVWGSYFFHPEPVKKKKGEKILSRASSFAKRKLSTGELGPLVGRSESLRTPTSSATKEMNKVMGRLRRGSSFTGGDLDNPANGGPGGSMVTPPGPGSRMKSGPEPVPSPWGGMLRPRDCSPAFTRLGNSAENSPEGSLSRCETPGLELIGERLDGRGDTSAPATPSGTPEVPPPAEDQPPPRGVGRINTLWGSCIQKYAKMCIPDLDVLVDYPIDYKYPIFSKSGSEAKSGSKTLTIEIWTI